MSPIHLRLFAWRRLEPPHGNHVWDLKSGRKLRTRKGHSHQVIGVAVTADGKRAVSGSTDKTLKVWDLKAKLWNLKNWRALRTLEGHSDSVYGVAVTADGKRAVSASWDWTLKVWNLESGREVRTLEGHSGVIWAVAMTADGKRAVSASNDRTLKVWDLESGLAIATFHCDAQALCCAFAEQRIVAGDEGGNVHFLLLEESRTPGAKARV